MRRGPACGGRASSPEPVNQNQVNERRFGMITGLGRLPEDRKTGCGGFRCKIIAPVSFTLQFHLPGRFGSRRSEVQILSPRLRRNSLFDEGLRFLFLDTTSTIVVPHLAYLGAAFLSSNREWMGGGRVSSPRGRRREGQPQVACRSLAPRMGSRLRAANCRSVGASLVPRRKTHVPERVDPPADLRSPKGMSHLHPSFRRSEFGTRTPRTNFLLRLP